MKKMASLAWVTLFLPALLFAQEKIDAPTWKVGDKWVFNQGKVEVIGADKTSYALNFSKDICIVENVGFETIIFEKSTRNRIYLINEDKRERYLMALSKLLDFPLSIGKQWKTEYSSPGPGAYDYKIFYRFSESYKVLGWENIVVKAGSFKAIKLAYNRVVTGASNTWYAMGGEIIHQYWYSPEVKYFVKCQYDLTDWMKDNKEIFNWELVSYELKK